MSDNLKVPDLDKDLKSAGGQIEATPDKKKELPVPDLDKDLGGRGATIPPQKEKSLPVPDLSHDLTSVGASTAVAEKPKDLVGGFSAQLQQQGPKATKAEDFQRMVGAFTPEQTQKVIQTHPWAYNYLTPEQKTEQYKFSRSQSPFTWDAAKNAALATGGFFGDLIKSGWNVGLDAAYAGIVAPVKDAVDRGTIFADSDKDRPRTVEAYQKLGADTRDAAGSLAQSAIEAKRSIERIHGGEFSLDDFTRPSVARYAAGFGFAPLYLATQMAEMGLNPNSGSIAAVDNLNRTFGLETPEMEQHHWDVRKTYDANRGAEDWVASGGEPKTSPWSKVLYSEPGQKLMYLREKSKLPDAETFAALNNVPVDRAKQTLEKEALDNADKATRELTLKWNREYNPETEALGSMLLGPASMGEAGIGLGGAGLMKKLATGAETLGLSDEAANAYFTAKAAREAAKLRESIEEAKKTGWIGQKAANIENAQTRLAEAARAKFESLPPVVQKWAPIVLGKTALGGAGAVVGDILSPEDRTKGILGGITLATGIGATPGILRSLSDARKFIGAGEGGLFEQAGKMGTSTKTTQLLFGGNRGKVTDYVAKNLNTMLRSGVSMSGLNAATSTFNSDDPKKFVESVGEGLGMGAAFPLFHKGAGVFRSIDPEAELAERKKRDVEIYEAFNRADAPTQANLSKLTDFNNAVNRARTHQAQMQGFLEEAVKSGDQKKINEATKAKNVADALLKQVLRANVQTRNEYGRKFMSLYTDINALANGTRRAGQPRLQMQLRTKDEIMEDLIKQAKEKNLPIDPAEIEHQADQQGYYTRDGKFVVNVDRILARQALFGESPNEALLHEGAGHGLYNIPEFRTLNKTAENLLFDRYDRDLQGNIVDTKEGRYSDDELVNMYLDKYLSGEDQAGKMQFAKSSGLLDEKGQLDRAKVVNYMKEEIIAELNAGNLRDGLGKIKNTSPVENWINSNLKTSMLARAVQAVTGLGIKPFASSVVGAKFDTDVVEANRRALKALADFNGRFTETTEEEQGTEIPEKEMRSNPNTRRRYGLQGGEFKTQLVGVVRDANGNIVSKVPIANPNAAEGTWEHDQENNKVKQTRGYGQVPDEFQGVQVPDGGSLEVSRDFVYEPDGKTPIRNSDRDLANLEKSRGDLIRQALESADDRFGETGLLPFSADGLSWKGIMSPKQIEAIKQIPESILPLSIKEKIFAFNEALARGEGDTFDLDYAARLGKGKKYKGRRSEIYHTIPIGFAFSKEGNFLLRTLSMGALFRKVKARQQRMHGYFAPWNNDTNLFMKELQDTYLKNTFNENPGWLGLDPNNPTEETPLAKLKKDRFNDMMNLVNADTRAFNENRMVTPRDKSVRGSKPGDVDNLWRDHRLDAIADFVNTTEATGGYPMDTKRIYKNFLPAEKTETKPAEAPKEETNPIFKALGAVKASYVGPEQRTPYTKPESRANQDVQRISENYVKNAGMEYRPHGQAVPANEELAKRIADHYETAKNEPLKPEVKKAYTAMANEVVNQWKAFEQAGYTATPWTGEGQPYANSAEMMKDVRDNKHLYYFQTKEGYGESGITDKMRAENPMLQDSGVNFNGAENVPVNDVFRVVHDIVGHGANGYEFGPKGEFNAYLEHSRMFSDAAKAALAAETLAQNSWVNYGPHLRDEGGNIAKKGEKGYVPVTERPFAEQKNISLPQEFIDAAEQQAKNAIDSQAQKPVNQGINQPITTDATKQTPQYLPEKSTPAQGDTQAQGAQPADSQARERERVRLHSGLAAVARAAQGSSQEGVPGAEKSVSARKVAEAQALLDHAEEAGLLGDPDAFFKQWQLDGSEAGGEHQVSFPPGPDVIKRTPNPNYPTWADYFDSLNVHNALFPKAALTFRKFQNVEGSGGVDIDGQKWPAGLYSEVSQPFLEISRGLSVPETDALMKTRGFYRVRPMEYYSPELKIHVTDLHGQNAVMLRDQSGKEFPYVIDSYIRPTGEKDAADVKRIEDQVGTKEGLSFLPAKKLTVQHASEEKEGSVGGDLDLVHFGAYGVNTADPKKMGKGSATGIDRSGLPKTYFYLNGTKYESGIQEQTPYLAKVDGNSIYDLDADPLGLQQVNREAMDKAIKDAGFAGYMSRKKPGQNFDAVALFKPTKLTEALPTDVFSKKEAKRRMEAGGPEIDYAAQDEAFYGPSFLPAKDKPTVTPEGHVLAPEDTEKSFTATPEILLNFLPASKGVDLEKYKDRPIISLPADRMGVGKAYVGPQGKKKEASIERQGGPAFPTIYFTKDKDNNPVWAFSTEDSASRFCTRIRGESKAKNVESILVAPTLLSPTNLLHSPSGQQFLVDALRTGIELGDLKKSKVDAHVREILSRVKASADVSEDQKKVIGKAKTLDDLADLVKQKLLNFKTGAALKERAGQATLPISTEDMERFGISPSAIAQSLAHEGFYHLPDYTIVSLFEVPADVKPEKEDFHHSYPYIVRGKPIGFLKNLFNLSDVTSDTRIFNKRGQITAQPVMSVLPSLDPVKIEKALKDLKYVPAP